MVLSSGYIRLSRKLLEWEYYKDINTYKLFVHFLLTANFKDTKIYGFIVPRGSLIIKEDRIGCDCGLTYSEVRTALKKLVKSGCISKKSTNKFTIINVVNYDIYQASCDDDERTTREQFANNSRTIDEPLASLEEEGKKEIRKERKKKELALALPSLRERYKPEQLAIIDQFFEILKHTRRSAKLADGIVLKCYEDWLKYDASKVAYALHKYIHTSSMHDKKEDYVLGIIRNASASEIDKYRESITHGNNSSRNSTDGFIRAGNANGGNKASTELDEAIFRNNLRWKDV